MVTFHFVVSFSGHGFGSTILISPLRSGPRHCVQSCADAIAARTIATGKTLLNRRGNATRIRLDRDGLGISLSIDSQSDGIIAGLQSTPAASATTASSAAASRGYRASTRVARGSFHRRAAPTTTASTSATTRSTDRDAMHPRRG